MAIYTYNCEKHGEFDLWFPITAMPKEAPCPNCNTMCKKVFIPKANFQLKGEGWPGKAIKEERVKESGKEN